MSYKESVFFGAGILVLLWHKGQVVLAPISDQDGPVVSSEGNHGLDGVRLSQGSGVNGYNAP